MNTITNFSSDEPQAARNGKVSPSVAEFNLLNHLALMGELADRRDALQNELGVVTQMFQQARQRKQELIQEVQEAGGLLPRWPLDDSTGV